MKKIENVIGLQYGRLAITAEADPRVTAKGVRIRRVVVKCECGQTKTVCLRELRSGDTTSCGCYMRETSAKRAKTHGLSKHKLYRVWLSIVSRCTDPRNADYGNYGRRGITVCNGWAESFPAFFAWCMSNGWTQGLHTDRIDNDGPYSPENCRFVPAAKNVRNGRVTHLTETDVRYIRELRGMGISQVVIGKMYRVGQSTVSDITRGRTWVLR